MAFRAKPTIQNHQSLHTPQPECVTKYQWWWPFYKFGFASPAVLFTELHAEYNSISIAIQDPQGWHLDVNEIANIAETREQFLTLLRERQDERFAELRATWEKTRTQLVADPTQWNEAPERSKQWFNFVRCSRNFSYDAFLSYFGAWVKDESKTTRALTENEHTDTDTESEGKSQKLLGQAGDNEKGQVSTVKAPKLGHKDAGETRTSTSTNASSTSSVDTKEKPTARVARPRTTTRTNRVEKRKLRSKISGASYHLNNLGRRSRIQRRRRNSL
ncbi:hypothetical protein F4808DRAFT_472986 [Astrocystis sublimbata]|nr:hypothetical protein F4808DRAFT_472986 [Astrocystis sublimbata]